ncbi:DNA alkylation repair protein [Actinomadura parmotrematis]|uniref:DNA alkylation repair protein n=1 Tax=Actinomadura parmotrematis TaxID=2864039 RepID=A0ABS7G4K5_9ACTN|nr:DNA alkylation repair protein [Actinomadura parmotrematis]MBW8487406.1 DNA alkylation repair protein [Actinomadura parmotrematis]
MDVAEEAARIEAELRALADPDRARYERRYLKSDLAHLGVPVPAIRKIALPAVRDVPPRADLRALANVLWAAREGGRPLHETRVAAIEVLVRRAEILDTRDLGFAERLIRDSATWAHVDGLAEKVVGVLLSRHPETGTALDGWVADPCMWIRRSALLALLPGVRRGTPDLARLSRYGDAVLAEKEFFIRKALGWLLREQARHDPAWVRDWTAARIGAVSGVTFREAVRRLPKSDAAALTAAYRAR